MRAPIRRLIAGIGFALLAGGVATADSDADGVIGFGLLGAWAVDCRRPPSADNPHAFFAISTPGQPTETIDMGPGVRLTADLRNVHRIAPDRLALLYVGTPQGRSFDIVLVKVGERFRSEQSVGSDGVALIKDGKFVFGGEPTPLFESCSRGTAQTRDGLLGALKHHALRPGKMTGGNSATWSPRRRSASQG